MTVEHRQLSFHKHLDVFNAQAYRIFAPKLKNVKLTLALSNKVKKRQLYRHIAYTHLTTIFL